MPESKDKPDYLGAMKAALRDLASGAEKSRKEFNQSRHEDRAGTLAGLEEVLRKKSNANPNS